MDRVYPRCAGIDVHKDSLVVCVRQDGRELPVETFGATSREILRLGDWLAERGVTIAAMESTGVYWQPVWNLLEDRLQLMLGEFDRDHRRRDGKLAVRRSLLRADRDALALPQHDRLLEVADAQLRPLEIGDQCDRMTDVGLRGANALDPLRVLLMRTVREVKTRRVHPRPRQRPQHLR